MEQISGSDILTLAITRATKVIERQNSIISKAAAAWLIAGEPGSHTGELIIEQRAMDFSPNMGAQRLRVIAGPLWDKEQGGAGPIVAQVPGVRLSVVIEEPEV